MKALTIKQPWASLIAAGAKDIENRDWQTKVRGIVAIHSSAKLEQSEIEDACDLMRGFIPKFSAARFKQDRLPTGVILGAVEIVGCVRQSDSPWFVGEYGFQLRNAVRFGNPIRCRGALGFWEVPEKIVALMREEYRNALEEAATAR